MTLILQIKILQKFWREIFDRHFCNSNWKNQPWQNHKIKMLNLVNWWPTNNTPMDCNYEKTLLIIKIIHSLIYSYRNERRTIINRSVHTVSNFLHKNPILFSRRLPITISQLTEEKYFIIYLPEWLINLSNFRSNQWRWSVPLLTKLQIEID